MIVCSMQPFMIKELIILKFSNRAVFHYFALEMSLLRLDALFTL